MNNSSLVNHLKSWFAIKITTLLGAFFGATAITLFEAYLRDFINLSGFNLGVLAGLFPIIVITFSTRLIFIIQAGNWYIPVSWLLLGLTIGNTIALTFLAPMEVTLGFAATYVCGIISFPTGLLVCLVGFHAMCVVGMTAIYTLIWFAIAFLTKLSINIIV